MERHIPPAERRAFFSRISSGHEGALVTVRIGALDLIKGQPFHGVSPDGADVIVHTGNGSHVGHRIDDVTAIVLEQSSDDADAAVSMIGRDGTRTEIRFQWPMRADLLDPAVE